MHLIAHRGNFCGANPELENSPTQILRAFDAGFEVEVDVRMIANSIYFGHDNAKYNIDLKFIEKHSNELWLHCKNAEALMFFSKEVSCNFFWQENDDFTLTSRGYIWCHSRRPLIHRKAIVVYPKQYIEGVCGVCDDNLMQYVK